MKKYMVGAILVIVFAIIFVAIIIAALSAADIPDTVDRDTLWGKIQIWRSDNNLPPYVFDRELCMVAQQRLRQIQRDFSHNGFTAEAGKTNYLKVSENLATNEVDEHLILQGWLASASHSAALRADYKYSCLVTDGLHVVHIFANL